MPPHFAREAGRRVDCTQHRAAIVLCVNLQEQICWAPVTLVHVKEAVDFLILLTKLGTLPIVMHIIS